MKQKARIIRVITYYKLQRKPEKSVLKSMIEHLCEFKGNTFNYKMNKKNISPTELEKIENVIKHHKNGTINLLRVQQQAEGDN